MIDEFEPASDCSFFFGVERLLVDVVVVFVLVDVGLEGRSKNTIQKYGEML